MKFFEIKEEDKSFKSASLWNPLPTFPVYGGQIVSQALRSAYNYVEENMDVHSLHCYFISPGIVDKNIKYNSFAFKDGKTIANRNIQAVQNEKIICNMNVSFRIACVNGLNYQKDIGIEEVEFKKFKQYIRDTIKDNQTVKVVLNHIAYLEEYIDIFISCDSKNRRYMKFVLKEKLEDRKSAACFIAFISDFFLIEPALLVLNENFFSGNIEKVASIDHSLYFHGLIDTENDEYLFITECLNIDGVKAFCMGKLYDKGGKMIASAYQEGLIKMKK